MSEFKFEKAVTQAFQTSGGKQFGWRLIFWAAAVITVVSLISMPMMLSHYGELIVVNQQNMQAILGGDPNSIDNAATNAVLLKLMPSYILWMLGVWAAWVAAEAALHRKVIFEAEASRQPLRLGKDELRVFLAQLGVFGLLFLIYMLGIFLFVALFAIPVIGPVLGLLGFIALPCFLVLASVRLAPASALSIRNNKVHVMAAKTLTKGKFWTLFPAYLVVFIGGYIIIYLVMIIGIGLVTGDFNFFMAMSGFGQDDPQEMIAAAAKRLDNPLIMLMGVLSVIAYSAAYTLWMISLIGISSHAVKVWARD